MDLTIFKFVATQKLLQTTTLPYQPEIGKMEQNTDKVCSDTILSLIPVVSSCRCLPVVLSMKLLIVELLLSHLLKGSDQFCRTMH